MGKYLIQDIIPPEKKRRTAVRTHTKKSPEIETTLPRGEDPMPQPSLSRRLPISKEFPENIHAKVVDQIWHDQVGGTKEKVQGENRILPKQEIVIEPTGATYDEGEHEESASLPADKPPRFPEYSASGNFLRNSMKSWLPWLLGCGVFVTLVVLVLNYFAGATVTIVPKHNKIGMDQKIIAEKNATLPGLSYAVMIETASSSLEVAATGEKTVTTKASGKIVVYNEQTIAQRLIKNTRFQSASGKIYRINDSINLPKATTVNGKLAPGFLEVTVYADEAGPTYNIDPTDFTLPGLKSSPLFTKVYARSKGKISGGASGTVKTVSDQDLKQAGEDLRVALETKLRGKARGNLAPSQIVYDKGIVVALAPPALSQASASANNKAVVSAEGTIYLVTFKRADLIRVALNALVPPHKDESVDIKNLDALQFEMDTQKGSDLVSGNKLNFTLKGTPEFVWVIDEEAIKSKILGTNKNQFNGILAQFSSVEHAEATIRPMWKHSFPKKAQQISVVLVDEISKE